MTGVQEMILAPEPGPHGKLHLFGGWPTEWDVDFRLHAPGQTVVEGVLRGGKLASLRVTPAARAKDVVNWLGRQPAYDPLPAPLSLGRPATASSQFDQPGYEPARAVDGDPTTRWASAMDARDGWLAVDLGAEKLVGRVWMAEIEWQETREFVIEVKQGD
ncbi:MAG: discoidin domain-containing protein, partial [Armatimonadetes bacterium]|nr:discoidin domain-containing protein [Armatimonadota bacterium]